MCAAGILLYYFMALVQFYQNTKTVLAFKRSWRTTYVWNVWILSETAASGNRIRFRDEH